MGFASEKHQPYQVQSIYVRESVPSFSFVLVSFNFCGLFVADLAKPEHLTCIKCATEIEVSPLKVREQRFY